MVRARPIAEMTFCISTAGDQGSSNTDSPAMPMLTATATTAEITGERAARTLPNTANRIRSVSGRAMILPSRALRSLASLTSALRKKLPVR